MIVKEEQKKTFILSDKGTGIENNILNISVIILVFCNK